MKEARHVLSFVLAALVVTSCGGGATSTTAVPSVTEVAPAPSGGGGTSAPTPDPAPPAFSRDSTEPGTQHAYSFTSASGVDIEYLLYVPQGYDEGTAWPVILFLHGFLGTDQTLESMRTKNPVAWLDPNAAFPFVLVAPKGPDGLWSEYHEPLEELLDALGDSLSLDPEGVFLTGLSAGASGVWGWAMAQPDRFAGIAPVAGGPSMSQSDPVPPDICRLVSLPIWIGHGEADGHVPIASMAAVVAALEECGSTTVRFTSYQGLDHAASISTAYAGPDLYEWMLEQVP